MACCLRGVARWVAASGGGSPGRLRQSRRLVPACQVHCGEWWASHAVLTSLGLPSSYCPLFPLRGAFNPRSGIGVGVRRRSVSEMARASIILCAAVGATTVCASVGTAPAEGTHRVLIRCVGTQWSGVQVCATAQTLPRVRPPRATRTPTRYRRTTTSSSRSFAGTNLHRRRLELEHLENATELGCGAADPATCAFVGTAGIVTSSILADLRSRGDVEGEYIRESRRRLQIKTAQRSESDESTPFSTLAPNAAAPQVSQSLSIHLFVHTAPSRRRRTILTAWTRARATTPLFPLT